MKEDKPPLDAEQYELDRIWERLDRPKKVSSGPKGDRGELGVIELLKERFGLPFSRVPESGARASQVELPEELKLAFVGDVVVPPAFRFCVECKNGYDDIGLDSIVFRGATNTQLDEFLAQAERDAARVGRSPMLCWKKTRKPYLAFVREDVLGGHGLRYRGWNAIPLKELLLRPDDFFLRGAS